MNSFRFPKTILLTFGIWSFASLHLSRAYLEPSRKNFFLKLLISGMVAIAMVFRKLRQTVKPDPGKENPSQDSSRR